MDRSPIPLVVFSIDDLRHGSTGDLLQDSAVRLSFTKASVRQVNDASSNFLAGGEICRECQKLLPGESDGLCSSRKFHPFKAASSLCISVSRSRPLNKSFISQPG